MFYLTLSNRTFIAGNYTKPPVTFPFDQYASQILESAKIETEPFFRTRHTGWPASLRERQMVTKLAADGKHFGTIIYTVWSDVYVCPHCSHDFSFWDAAVELFESSVEDVFPCPTCNANLCKESKYVKNGASLVDRAIETWMDPLLGQVTSRQKRKASLISYECFGKRYEKYPDAEDLKIIAASDAFIPILPVQDMMGGGSKWGDTWRAGVHTGVTHVHQFFTNRTLAVLGILRTKRGRDTLFEFLVTSGMLRMSRLNRYMPQHRDNRNKRSSVRYRVPFICQAFRLS